MLLDHESNSDVKISNCILQEGETESGSLVLYSCLYMLFDLLFFRTVFCVYIGT